MTVRIMMMIVLMMVNLNVVQICQAAREKWATVRERRLTTRLAALQVVMVVMIMVIMMMVVMIYK